MPSKLRFLLPVVLTVLLGLASAHNVFALTEIAYDSGSASVPAGWPYEAVRFTPSGPVKIIGIKVYPSCFPISVGGFITGPDHTTVLLSFTISFSSAAWQTLTVNGPIVSGDFFIAIGQLYVCFIWGDGTNDYGRSYRGTTLSSLSVYGGDGDLLIRALVEPQGGVGGIVLPTNTYLTLAPYLAVIGLVATVAVAVKKRRN